MSSLIKKVAVAGATGNTGPTVIKTLSASGFEVTALTRSTAKAKSLLSFDVKIVEVDYLSHDSLVSALRGSDAIVVCGVGMLPEQINLIDAAIAAGVPRFLPADFGGDLTIPLHRALNVNRDKVATEEYLQQHESSISHTSIRTGPLLDFCLSRGVLVNIKDRSVILFDSGDKHFSTTTIATAGAAVAAALKMGDKSKNRAFKVQDIVTTQNELLRLSKEVLPGAEWTVKPASTEDMANKANEAFKLDPNSRMGSVMQKAVGVFGAEYISDFGMSDNAELGLRTMDETQVKELLRKFA
ncbi:hypothetical protein MMC11_000317 [Xylographa trunciseda]|nr:hypothetical protein [Xylographa trunciseda]